MVGGRRGREGGGSRRTKRVGLEEASFDQHFEAATKVCDSRSSLPTPIRGDNMNVFIIREWDLGELGGLGAVEEERFPVAAEHSEVLVRYASWTNESTRSFAKLIDKSSAKRRKKKGERRNLPFAPACFT